MARFTLLLILLGAFLAPLSAQTPCFLGDDGFAVGCCATPVANLPNLPPVFVRGRHGCLDNCALVADGTVDLAIGAPVFLTCDIVAMSITVTPTGGAAPGYAGTLVGKYARTWLDTGLTGVTSQVWRFMVNGQLVPFGATSATVPCPFPPCALAGSCGGTVHFVGSIDYTCDPTAPGATAVRLDLSHHQGCLSHAPWSACPLAGGASHASRSYHVVAPDNFVWGPVFEPQGVLMGESVRGTEFTAAGGFVCKGEAELLQGNLNTVGSSCLCGSTTAGGWRHQNIIGSTFCGGTTPQFNNTPFSVLPTGFSALPLGFWTPPAGSTSFPGFRELVVYIGVIQWVDPCSTNWPVHLVTGTATTSNPPGTTFGSATMPPQSYNTFLDLVNHKDPTGPFTIFGFTPTFGKLSFGDVVWNLNPM